jgi:hypothetical protein
MRRKRREGKRGRQREGGLIKDEKKTERRTPKKERK